MPGAAGSARLWLGALIAAASMACAARAPARPSGTSSASADAVSIFEGATAACEGVRTLNTELALSGHAGDERVRGRVIAGLERGGAAHLEGVAPFGPPIFVLVSRAEQATLLLPRDKRVLPSATVSAVLERLTGLPLGADELLRTLTGCIGADAEPRDGRQWPGGWRGVSVGTDQHVFLREQSGRWSVVAADAGAWRADYADVLSGYPRSVRLRSADGRVDLMARIRQLEVNTPIDPAAFELSVPPGTEPMTIDELRTVAPLRAPSDQ